MVPSSPPKGSRVSRSSSNGSNGSPSSNLYRELAEIPMYTKAEFVKTSNEPPNSRNAANDPAVIRVTTSVSDHLRNTKRTMVKYVTAASPYFATPAQDAGDAAASFASPSGSLCAVLREVAVEGGDKKRFVEIWKGDTLKAEKEVTKLHGAFYTDEVFASSSFCPSETAIVYTAEVNAKEDTKCSYDKYRYEPDFGERLIGRKRPNIFIFRWGPTIPEAEADPDSPSGPTYSLSSPRISVARLTPTNVPEDLRVFFGQAVFHSDDHVFATGYEETADGRLLGVTGCYNRPSSIWEFTLPAYVDRRSATCACVAERLTLRTRSCRSPRVVRHEQRSTLIWLSHELGGPHHSCACLHSRSLDTGAEQILVDTVWEPGKDDFCGLYLEQLPPQPLLVIQSKPYIVTHSVRRFHNAIHLISLDNSEPSRVVHPDQRGQVYNWTVLNTDGRSHFLCSRSRTDVPNELVLAWFSSPGQVRVQVINKPALSPRVNHALDRLCQSVVTHPTRRHVETIVIDTIESGASERVKPCITMPHGGPHIASTNAFNPLVAALALEGYIISMPNYTGSLGYGLKHITSIQGNCGTVDVKDCFELTQCLIDKGMAKEGPGCQFIHGGSHGGFLGAHLIGQYPTFFTAAALRNPVISAGEMFSVTDIPDWDCAELTGKDRTATTILTPDLFNNLQRCSPITHIDKVQAHVLLLIGEGDRRVPSSQGRNYYHALKGRGKSVDMLWFPGKGHALDDVETAKMVFESVRDLFAKHRR